MPVEYSPSITSARIIPSLLRCPPERGKIKFVRSTSRSPFGSAAPRSKFDVPWRQVFRVADAWFHARAWRGNLGHIHRRRHDGFDPAARHRFGEGWITQATIRQRAPKRGDETRFAIGQ